MVIQEDSDEPMELPINRAPALTTPMPSSKFVVVRNHVRELRAGAGAGADTVDDDHTKAKKKTKVKTKEAPVADVAQQDPSSADQLEEIKDLAELRTVYFHCKRILSKIERKYGDRLNLKTDSADSLSRSASRHKRKCNEDFESDDDLLSGGTCSCERNTKIVFDDGDNEVLSNSLNAHHICVPKSTSTGQRSVQIEYGPSDSELPDSLLELSTLLRNDSLPATRRNLIINKIRMLRVELGNELRYHRSALLEQLRRAPNDLLEFPGSNLFSLSGYS